MTNTSETNRARLGALLTTVALVTAACGFPPPPANLGTCKLSPPHAVARPRAGNGTEIGASLAISGNELYIAASPQQLAGGAMLAVADVRDPEHPTWVATYQPTPDDIKQHFSNTDMVGVWITHILVNGPVIYASFAHGRGIGIFERVATDTIAFRGYSENHRVGQSWDMGVCRDGNRLALASGTDGLNLYDLSDALHPRLLGNCDTKMAFGCAMRGSTVISADWMSGLHACSFTDPTAPADLFTLEIAGGSREAVGKLIWRDNLLYAAGPCLFAIIDLQDVRSPLVLAKLHLDTLGNDLAVEGDRAFIAADDWGVLVIDIKDPRAPHLMGTIPLSSQGGNCIAKKDEIVFATPHRRMGYFGQVDHPLLETIDVSGCRP